MAWLHFLLKWLVVPTKRREARAMNESVSARVNTEENKKKLTPWRGVEPRSRAVRRMTGACTNPIYYQGLDWIALRPYIALLA